MYFRHISLCFYSNFDWERSLDAELNFCIQRVPTRHTFDGPRYPKKKKYLKKCDDISCFWGSGVCQKYAEWVLARWMRNLISHSMSSPDRNLSKNIGRYVENTNKKSSFFMIPIPKFILKNCLRSIWYFKFKAISLDNT